MVQNWGDGKLPSSFRDPSGFLFQRCGKLYRQINLAYRDDYDRLTAPGGLYERLRSEGLLIGHTEVDVASHDASRAYKIIEPGRLGFISYPYEWSFSQLKDAARLTLRIQRLALEHGMSLKDASAYNAQFHGSRPVFIDTLSFESYREGEPWVAYRQFCRHFLAPLALMSYADVRLSQLFRTNIDGVPLDLGSALLPLRTWWRFSLLTHVHLHARLERRYGDIARSHPKTVARAKLSKFRFFALIDHLQAAIEHLSWKSRRSEWSEYYEDTNYSAQSLNRKQQLVHEFVRQVRPGSVWDLGANTGVFSRIAAEARGSGNHDAAHESPVVSFDMDPAAVEKNYRSCRDERRTDILPLVLDLTNPSPGLGWHNRERAALVERGPADAVLALALIHHLAISNHLPFDSIARFIAAVGRSAIIEFVPKVDSQVQRLLATRQDVFADYHQDAFEQAFGRHFRIVRSAPIDGSLRTLYLMTNLAER